VRNGDLESVIFLIEKCGLDVDSQFHVKCGQKMPIVDIAITKRHVDIALYLCSRGCNLHHVTECGLTPLDLAIDYRLFDLTAILVSEHKLDPWVCPGDEMALSPIEVLVSNGFGNVDYTGLSAENGLVSTHWERKRIVAIFNVFLDHKKSDDVITTKDLINRQRPPTGQTLLMLALQSRNLVLAELLLARGADVTLIDKNGNSALHFAISNMDTCQMIRPLIESAFDKFRAEEERSVAAAQGHEAQNASTLTSSCLDRLGRFVMRAGGIWGFVNPLDSCIKWPWLVTNCPDMLSVIEEWFVSREFHHSRCPCNLARDNYLSLAIQNQNLKVFLSLLLAGFDPQELDGHGKTAFFYACQRTIYDETSAYVGILNELGYHKKGREIQNERTRDAHLLSKAALKAAEGGGGEGGKARSPPSLSKCVRNSLVKSPWRRLQMVRILKDWRMPQHVIDILEFNDVRAAIHRYVASRRNRALVFPRDNQLPFAIRNN